MSVTAFIGAGAVLGIGGPTTADLTAAIKRRRQWRGNPRHRFAKVSAIREVADALDLYFQPATANFEDIFHAIESLESLRVGLQAGTAKEFKPALGAFVTRNAGTLDNPIVIKQALNQIIDEVASKVMRYVRGFRPRTTHLWFRDFWRNATARCPLDVATLNYDDCIERSLHPGSWDDGFANLDPGIFRFDPIRITNSRGTRVIHMHGSVFYGYPQFRNPNRFLFEDQHEDLYRFTSHRQAKLNWHWRSQNHAQSGDSAIAGPIITGQRKTDKLLAYPYSTYQTVLHDALLKNSRLLIAGYGFGDLHFNRLLGRLTRIHGDNRRVVLIDFVPMNLRGAGWHPDPAVRDWPNDNTLQAAGILGRENRPLEGRYRHPWVSSDGRCRVYLEGFQDAVQNHGADIINFLTT